MGNGKVGKRDKSEGDGEWEGGKERERKIRDRRMSDSPKKRDRMRGGRGE